MFCSVFYSNWPLVKFNPPEILRIILVKPYWSARSLFFTIVMSLLIHRKTCAVAQTASLSCWRFQVFLPHLLAKHFKMRPTGIAIKQCSHSYPQNEICEWCARVHLNFIVICIMACIGQGVPADGNSVRWSFI